MNPDQEESWNKLQGKVEAYIKDEHGHIQKIWIDPKHIQVSFVDDYVMGERRPEVVVYNIKRKTELDRKDNMDQRMKGEQQ